MSHEHDADIEPVGRLDVMAFDCPDALALAGFYQRLLGGAIVEHEAGGWVELHSPGGKLAFQRVDDHRPPTWPEADVPQQAHVDIRVDDLDVAETLAVGRGATKAATQPEPKAFRVFIDPAGHPFCLVLPWPSAHDS